MKDLVRLFVFSMILTIPVLLLLQNYIEMSVVGMMLFSIFFGIFSVIHSLVKESNNINTYTNNKR
jgi:hypothetical protein